MNNDDANFYIDFHNKLNERIKEGIIDKFSIDPEEKTVYLEKTLHLKAAVKYIHVDMCITPTGVTWNGM